MIYIKLSDSELHQLYLRFKAYFETDEVTANQIPPTTHSVLLRFESGFNDEGYFVMPREVVVYDESGAGTRPQNRHEGRS